MKWSSKRDVPIGAAASIVALVLLATVVTGRDEAVAPAPALERATPPAPSVAERDSATASEELDLKRLTRPKKDDAPEPQDLFAVRSLTPPTPTPVASTAPSKPATPPAPTAPPLPFKYLGRKIDGERIVIFLEKGGDAYRVVLGDVLDNTYRVDLISESAVGFVYLPLGTKQTLNVPPSN